MGTIALIPVKPISLAKSRLAVVASPQERRRLAEAMLEDVLMAVAGARTRTRMSVTVVGSDDGAARAAARFGFGFHCDADGTLNDQLDRARRIACASEYGGLLCLPADVPCITPADVHALVQSAQAGAALCISPIDGGTNALCTRVARAVPFSYGTDSGRAHAAACEAAGLQVQQLQCPRLRDIDTPDDLAWLLDAGAHTRAGQVAMTTSLARQRRVA
jgi:2-phospho-L-lactate/phosphoenolpyruvate guanylyltransferase